MFLFALTEAACQNQNNFYEINNNARKKWN